MKRWMAAVALVVLLVGAGLFWAALPAETPEPEPQVEAPKPLPRPAKGRTVYHFTPPDLDAPPEPEPEEDWPEGATQSVPRDVIDDFSLASNEATGLMWEECLRPWRDSHEVEDAPLTVNLVLQDGRVGDVEVISPFPLEPELVTCMEDRVWSVEFPEHALHRGELRLQRTLSLTR